MKNWNWIVRRRQTAWCVRKHLIHTPSREREREFKCTDAVGRPVTAKCCVCSALTPFLVLPTSFCIHRSSSSSSSHFRHYQSCTRHIIHLLFSVFHVYKHISFCFHILVFDSLAIAALLLPIVAVASGLCFFFSLLFHVHIRFVCASSSLALSLFFFVWANIKWSGAFSHI